MSSIAGYFGPVGAIISGFLSCFSSILGIFAGGNTESQESMMTRIVETAINDAREKDMKEYVEGARHAYSVLSSSVADFREQMEKNEEPLSHGQAEQFYNHAFTELSVFGKLWFMYLSKALFMECQNSISYRRYDRLNFWTSILSRSVFWANLALKIVYLGL